MTDAPTPTSQIGRHSFEVLIEIDAPLETPEQVTHRLANLFRGSGMAVAVLSITETAADMAARAAAAQATVARAAKRTPKKRPSASP